MLNPVTENLTHGGHTNKIARRPVRVMEMKAVLGQRLVESPRADVDREEDEEYPEQEEAGCRGGHSEELHLQRSLQQPGLRGICEALRCHGNAAAPGRNLAFIT